MAATNTTLTMWRGDAVMNSVAFFLLCRLVQRCGGRGGVVAWWGKLTVTAPGMWIGSRPHPSTIAVPLAVVHLSPVSLYVAHCTCPKSPQIGAESLRTYNR